MSLGYTERKSISLRDAGKDVGDPERHPRESENYPKDFGYRGKVVDERLGRACYLCGATLAVVFSACVAARMNSSSPLVMSA